MENMEIPKASSISKVTAISTGLPQLDKVTGVGGIPFGRVSEISGKWSAGKTTLALQTIAEAQKQGIECVFFDAEFTWDNTHAEALGVDTNELGVLQVPFAEEGLDILLEVARTKKHTLMVIDAVGALHPREEAEKDSGSRTIGAQASLIARFLRKIVPLLSMNDHALLMLNHEYEAIGGIGVPTIETSGGKKLAYHRSMWIRLSRTGVNVKISDRIVGYKAKAEIRKNKLAPTERQSCELEMSYMEGFLAAASLFDDAVAAGVFEKRGNLWYMKDEKLGFEKKVKDMLKEQIFAEKIAHEIAA